MLVYDNELCALAFALAYAIERVLSVGDKFDVTRAALAVRWCNFPCDQAICHAFVCVSR